MSNNKTEVISVDVPSTTPKSNTNSDLIKSEPVKNETVVVAENNEDVTDILAKIKTHLARLNYAAKLDFEKDKKEDHILTVGNYKISRECLLHYLSGNPEFLKSDAKQCSTAIQNFSNTSGNLDLESLLNLSENKDFVRDTNFYKNLYGFNVSIADFIANNQEFKKTNFNTQVRILANYQEFLKQSIDYLNKYMNEYKVIDENLITKSYNLMYLLNMLTFRRANMGKNFNELGIVYNKLNQAIMNNIAIYNSIDKNKLGTLSVGKNDVIDKNVQDLINALKQKLESVNKQQTVLKNNVEEINRDANNLKKHVSKDVIGIADSLRNEVKEISVKNITTIDEKKK
ncbi:hypothetical protein QLL95_gp1118 [Cotonvirus japonicus]|uniref:Uncharacterized protein n=1 Tax=Cotonvirus japonicus TaxID=2811091 RepID=A0ABM7NS70_9VIRU|nr:hypothetical protein QLL95_gp1118 [Cotonvirus japonicus]BCS83005.1 hypothetical protein [Cotonvirus japonicus]